MTIDSIREKLFSRKSTDRISTTKRISKERIIELTDELFATYAKEKLDKRT
jgi:hypothetical protein